MLSQKTRFSDFLEKYGGQKGDAAQKYENYLKKLRESKRAGAKTVTGALGYRKGMKFGISQKEKDEKRKIWGDKWMLDAEELFDPKVTKLDEFGASKNKRAVYCRRENTTQPGCRFAHKLTKQIA